jgi:MarR family transcriptional regulator, organic hydroperoxide resistance regulator
MGSKQLAVKKTRRVPNGEGTQAILKHWQQAVPNDRLAHLVRDTARALVRSLQTRLAQHGVSFGHWAFLRILWESDGLTQRQLSDRAGVMEPTTFTAIKAMEKRGYILRAQLPGNRRKVYIHLTPKGRLLKSKLVPLAEEVNAVAIRGVKPADIGVTRRTMLTMLENLARDDLELSAKPRRVPRELSELAAARTGKTKRRA